MNVRVGRWTVDFLWRKARLIVETDGYRFHSGRAAFEDDHDRDLGLREHGHNVLRLTGKQIATEGDRVATWLSKHL